MTCAMSKHRLDQLVVERGLAESRERAQALILAGQVIVNGQKSSKPGHGIADDARIEVLERMPYVSRGGFKLAAALDHLSEIAHLLDEPIDHIDITQDEVRFFAGRCYVAAAVRNVTLPQGPVGRTPYAAEVGKVHCT